MHENPRIFVSSYTLRKCSKTVDFIHFRRYNTNGNRVIFFQYFIRFLKLYESIGEYKMREKIENFIAMSGAGVAIKSSKIGKSVGYEALQKKFVKSKQ